MLVGHDAVDAHFVGPSVLLVVLVVQNVSFKRIEIGVWEVQSPRLVVRQVFLGDVGIGLLRVKENFNLVLHWLSPWS